ncbi:MAG: glycoside hydrolase family 38 C-terminal domain-containing protein [Thermoanaerobaculia bacterium]
MPAPETTPPQPSVAGLRPRLYVVALSHLDTQWRWTARDTAAAFLPRTVDENEDRFDRFPHYRLNFEGAYRYRLLAECHPERFERVRLRVAEGRWFPSGAAWEAFDTNLPAPESIVRQLLYGTRYLESAVGRAGRDLFLPDCFGFSQALPTLAVHCGIVGFSTQKLRRGAEMRSAFGVPFPFGLWVGPDGSTLPAVLDPGEYGAQASSDLGADPVWIERFRGLAAAGRPDVLMTYQGLGDKGGALPAAAIQWLERARAGSGALEVRLADSEEIFRDLDPETRALLPVYDGELLLRLHATGCYSSRAELKRRHRQAEQLAQASERAAAIAHALGVRPGDRERLREAWLRILAHEMHDDLTGTSLVAAYRYSANDLALSLNELRQELEEAVGAVAATLDTAASRTTGTPLVVFNALGWERTDLVEVELAEPALSSGSLAVFDAQGREVPSQWHREGWITRGCFTGHVPSLGFSLFELRCSLREPADRRSELSADGNFLENERLRVEVDTQGDIASIFDKLDGRELLAAPIGLEILDNVSERFPSWEIRWEDTSRPARTRIAGPVRTVAIERGAARVAITIERTAEGSRFVQTISLAAGAAGDHVIIENAIDWRTDGALLKMRFPLSTPAEQALFDQGVGVARRPVATAQLYEVPAHQWAALRAGPDASGAGAAIANDCKYGWDHPALDTLRLTLLHTPRIGRRFRYQAQQDFGHHEIRVAIAPIRAGESLAGTVRFAERLNQPLRPFLAPASPAPEPEAPTRPQGLSFLALDHEAVAVQALKLAEEGDELVLRLREIAGESRQVEVHTSLPVQNLRAIDGCERPLAAEAPGGVGARKAPVKGQTLVPLRSFGLAAVALKLDSPLPVLARHKTGTSALALPWNSFAATSRGERARGGGLDGRGHSIPRELLPAALVRAGVELDLSHARRPGKPSGLLCAGQRLSTPAGFCRLVLLVAAFPEALEVAFVVDGLAVARRVAGGFAQLGRFDELRRGFFGRPTGAVVDGFLRTEPLALAIPHRHDRRGRIEPCSPVQFFTVELAVSLAGSQVELPRSGRLVVLAAAVSDSISPAARSLTPGGLLGGSP